MESVIDSFVLDYISPYKELLAYEYIWARESSSFKEIANLLSKQDKLPSEVVNELIALFKEEDPLYQEVKSLINEKLQKNKNFSILLKESHQYPDKLLDAKYPIDLFYYRGNPDLAHNKCISVVGTRQVSEEGKRRTNKLVYLLAQKDYTIVSGLAEGVDTIALSKAIEYNANVIGVIGTPVDEYYPKSNKDLQEKIACNHLLISQVPFYKYSKQPFNTKRFYFPERNKTMASLSLATIIVEASDTSGTLIQARSCLEQKRKLFILNSCFENPNIAWPKKYEKRGAIRVRKIEDIFTHLEEKELINGQKNSMDT
ncbi:MAG: DNA-processing protein DprA [Lachnoclostridium sp.]|jgi:DNA processing protein|nr:DNA-processing protein DprA [Lachnoclostridium sp.]